MRKKEREAGKKRTSVGVGPGQRGKIDRQSGWVWVCAHESEPQSFLPLSLLALGKGRKEGGSLLSSFRELSGPKQKDEGRRTSERVRPKASSADFPRPSLLLAPFDSSFRSHPIFPPLSLSSGVADFCGRKIPLTCVSEVSVCLRLRQYRPRSFPSPCLCCAAAAPTALPHPSTTIP